MSVIDPAPASAQATDGESGKLHRRALGVPDLVFFIVAASAPLTAVAGGQAATYLVTGNKGVPFMFIPLGIMLGAVRGRLRGDEPPRHERGRVLRVRRARSRQGAGRSARRSSRSIAYNAMQIGIYGLFGVAMGAFMADKVGIDLEWWAWCLIGGGVIGVLGVLQIDLNARVLAVLLILEVIIVALFDFAILADPGPEGITGVGFDPSVAFGTAVGATLTVLRRLVRRLRVGGDLLRGGQGPEADRRAGDVHRGRADRRVLRALELARRRSPRGRARSSTRARSSRAGSRRPTARRPTRRRCCSSPAPTGSARSGATRRRCCSRRACSRRCSRSTTRSRATRSRSAASACSRARSAACTRAPARRGSSSIVQTVLALAVVIDLRAVRRRPGAEAVHLADEHRRARRAAADGGHVVRGRRLLPRATRHAA